MTGTALSISIIETAGPSACPWERRDSMKLNKRLTAPLEKSPSKGGWTYEVMPGTGETATVVIQERLESGGN